MVKRATALLVALAALAAFTGGCASSGVKDINLRIVSLAELQKKAPNATYVVDPPDTLRIESLTDTSLSRDVTLRQDGCITLPFLDDVKVSGLTTIQIREMLESKYVKYYKEPRLLVTVTAYRSKRIYVYGEVGRQGTLPYTGTQTVMGVIGDVSGFTYRAAPTRVRVIRGDPEHPVIFIVNLKKLIYEGDRSQDVSLAQDDIVRVPPNALAWLGYQIDNLLFPFRSIFGAVTTASTATSSVTSFGQ